MKKYHLELKYLSEVLRDKSYNCGNCNECEEVYEKFITILKKINRK